MPRAVCHGRGGVIGKTDRLMGLLERHAAMSFVARDSMIIIQHFTKRLDLQWLEYAGALRDVDQLVGIGRFGRPDHARPSPRAAPKRLWETLADRCPGDKLAA